MTQTTSRTFEIDLSANGRLREKDFRQAIKDLQAMGWRFDPYHKVWTLVDEDGDTPEAYGFWYRIRAIGVDYVETTDLP